ncbi:hypothetical protein AAFF_G00045280 [Aldrovandia affinis]|uniref:Uncharacterized protein n=1 Tax=Aldrovandia affinis TaxID=143900 RepID=A0AAD7S263_9TELE|nr:hypothetical protein AAFF_G00045280 [Aldrovandia affinis]
MRPQRFVPLLRAVFQQPALSRDRLQSLPSLPELVQHHSLPLRRTSNDQRNPPRSSPISAFSSQQPQQSLRSAPRNGERGHLSICGRERATAELTGPPRPSVLSFSSFIFHFPPGKPFHIFNTLFLSALLHSAVHPPSFSQ